MVKTGIEITADFSGIDRVLEQTPAAVDRFLNMMAEDIVTDIVLSFDTSPDGKAYVREGVTHVSSQPGFPPNVDTGALRATIRQNRISNTEREVVAGTDYAEPLELGLVDGSTRPYMRPAFERKAQTIEADARNNLDLE